MTPELDQQLRALSNFPSPPGIAARLIELAQDPDLDIAKVGATISIDPALTTKILRIANSPMYAQRRRSETLRQALVVLGLNATLSLSLSFSLVKALRGAKPNGVNHPLFWRRSLLSGLAARGLGEAIGHPFLEELFLAGLVQDLGILALDRALPNLYRDTADIQIDHRALANFERKQFGHDHAAVGGWLMNRWSMPRRLVEAVELSHRQDIRRSLDPDDGFNRCVALAGAVADIFLCTDERACLEAAQQAERIFALDRERFATVLERVSAVLPDTAAVFETDLVADPVAVLERVRDVLALRDAEGLRDIGELRQEVATLTMRAIALDGQITHDPVSGAHDGVYVERILKDAFARAEQNHGTLSVGVCELDDLQRIRDRVGPQSDARVLQMSAQLIESQVRKVDTVGRCEGHEFVVILPDADPRAAAEIGQRIVLASQTTRHSVADQSLSITLSVGYATHHADYRFGSADELLKAARLALHSAKIKGPHHLSGYEPDRPAPRVRFL